MTLGIDGEGDVLSISRKLLLHLCGILLFLPLAVLASPPQAFVQAREQGQAFLMFRLGECYGVVPAHVMAGEFYASLVGNGAGTPHGDADLLQTFGYDLAVLRVTGGLAKDCGSFPVSVQNLDQFLAAAGAGQIVSVTADGGTARRNVTVRDVGLLNIRVAPATPDDELFKGLSGSVLKIGHRTVGILMAVDPESGEGRVLRQDRVLETLRPFFGLSGVSPRGAELPPERPSPANQFIDGIVEWSVPPLTPEHRVERLLEDGVWYGDLSSARFPVTLVLALSGAQARAISGVILLSDQVEPSTRKVRDVEVLTRLSESAGWMPVITGTQFESETEKHLRFAPVRARQLMLRFYSNWGDDAAVGLSGLRILEP